jgi:outer membrane lipoprotein-sorting protein
MSFLRRISTRRLLGLCAALVAAIGAGTAIAIAATGGGPTPPAKPLPEAIHDALAAPPVEGVTARIQFTDHLIESSSIGEGGDPLLQGASGRLWAARDGRLRVELQSDGGGGDTQALIDGDRFTLYDSGQNTVYRGTLPQHSDKPDRHGVPTVAQIQKKLTEVMGHADLSGAIPGDVAGRAAYGVRISPKHDGGLLGGAELAWDAANGVPLRAAVFAAGDSKPVLELTAKDISYGAVDGSVFAITPPADAKVVDLAPGHDSGNRQQREQPVTGAGPVQAKLPFQLTAPGTLAGRPRADVRLISSDRSPAALVTYGRGLDGIAVIESAARPQGAGRDRAPGGLELPKVSIGGVTGHQLDTALGTAITFTRGGVSYVVLGSVPPPAAEAAARAL